MQRKFPFRKDIAMFVDQVAILVGQTIKLWHTPNYSDKMTVLSILKLKF